LDGIGSFFLDDESFGEQFHSLILGCEGIEMIAWDYIFARIYRTNYIDINVSFIFLDDGAIALDGFDSHVDRRVGIERARLYLYNKSFRFSSLGLYIGEYHDSDK